MKVVHPEDHAFVVGIDHYPQLGCLSGAVNDAQAFANWLLSPVGGGLDGDNVTTVITTDEHKDKTIRPTRTRPARDDIVIPLDELHAQANGRPGFRLGRRLYLYFAGHGGAVQEETIGSGADVALLCANCAPDRLMHNVQAQLYADWFGRARFFDEVVLFMDCCRSSRLFIPALLLGQPYPKIVRSEEVEPARHLYGFATQWDHFAYESEAAAGEEPRGDFSKALLDGLTGGAADGEGTVTSERLDTFVTNSLRAQARGAIEADVQRPLFVFDRFRPITFQLPQSTPRFRLRFVQRSGSRDRVELWWGATTREATREGDDWIWMLPEAGYYVLRFGDEERVIRAFGQVRELVEREVPTGGSSR